MPYCGHFGCGCCSASCSKCGGMNWHADLEDGVCAQCRLEALQALLEKQEEQKQEELELSEVKPETGHRKLEL